MAEQNPDGARATAGQRAYNFAANGGGAITYRVLVSAMSLVIATLIGLMWTDIRGTLAQINTILSAQANAIAASSANIAVHERRLNDGDSSRTLLWQSIHDNDGKLGDHESRLRVLETRTRIPR